jgi:hypothetical protein
MASEEEEESGSEQSSDSPPSSSDLRDMIREEIAAALDGLPGLGADQGDGDQDGEDGEQDTTSMSLRSIEAAVEKAMKKAMGDLASKAPPKKKATPAKKVEPEPTPEEPSKRKWTEKLWS